MLNKFILLILIIFALAIRIVNIDQIPPSLNWDEVSIGYNAYSLLQTGADEWGEPYPVIFRAYGDYKLPVYIYLAIPSIALFGLNAFAVRLPSVIAGVVVVLFTYLLTKFLFKNKKISLFAAFLVAIEPWSFFLSRISLEANVALALIVSGMYYLVWSLKNKSNKIIIATILLAASMWTYNTARIFTPLIVFSTLVIYQNQVLAFFYRQKTSSILAGLIFGLFFAAMAVQLLSSEGSARYQNVAILNEAAIGKIEYLRNTSQLPNSINILINNRYVYFINNFLTNYSSHFNIDFLFDKGGSNYQFNIQNHGLLYAISFPLMIIGLISSFISQNYKKYKKPLVLLITWALLAPLAASFTRESPHTLRSLVFIPIPMIFTSLGINFLLENYKKYKLHLIILFIVVYFLLFLKYFNIYSSEYKNNYSWAWQYGHSQAVDFVNNHYDEYDTIIFSKKYGEPHEFLLFYSQWDPQSYRSDPNLIRYYQTDWYWVDGFDKFYFINEWDIPVETSDPWILESEKEIDVSGDVLLITSPNIYPQGWTVIESIYFLDGTKAFDIVKK